MTAWGQKRKSETTILMSVKPPKAEVARCRCHFRDVPEGDIHSGAKTVHHRRNVTFQFVEVAILKSLFVEILRPPDRITSNPVR